MFKKSSSLILLVIVTFIFSAVVAVSPALATPGITTDPYRGKTRGYRPPSYMIGDSTTVHMEDELRTYGYTGEINGKSARNVVELPAQVKDRLRNKSKIRTAIIALGTNGHPTWTKQKLINQVKALKKRNVKKIVLVTPFRDSNYPEWNDPSVPGHYYRTTETYAKWMRDIANSKKLGRGVCVADWASYVSKNRDLLHDGVHATPAGESAEAHIVLDALWNPCR